MNTIGTYGLSNPRQPQRGFGVGLAGLGAQEGASAMGQLGLSAAGETQRKIAGQQAEEQRVAGNTQLGASGGALAGAAYGAQTGNPWAAAIGAVIGAVAGNKLF